MTKRHFRFGMAYFGTRKMWVRTSRRAEDTGVIAPARLVIRDTHQEWDVQELWNLYMAKAIQALNDADQAVMDANETIAKVEEALYGEPSAEG